MTVREATAAFRHSRNAIDAVMIPPGVYRMGCDGHDEFDVVPDGRPVRRVRITQCFFLATYPATATQYATFMKATGASPPDGWLDPEFNRHCHPVVGVSWHEANAFCEWVGGRLPTEAEWEYACRAGTQTRYSFDGGWTALRDHGWCYDNADGATHPVGMKKPNQWGLYDMHGNVWEWCSDWYGPYSSVDTIDPQGPTTGTYRVDRGGSWATHARCCASAWRDCDVPTTRHMSLGFRVAWDG